jgi:hypothetical protein
MNKRIKGGGGLSRKLLAILLASGMMSSGALASDVYVDQAGDTGTFNITQSNGVNRVGTINTPSVFSGNNIAVDIIQNGTLNEADIQAVSATDTIINYDAQGGSNILEIDIANSGNELNVVKNGDGNRVTMCGTNSGAGTPAGASATCSTAVGVVDTTNNVNITGDSNTVNLALASANAVNNIDIGQTTPSSDNVVNITQSGADIHNVSLVINGDTNLINITQQ